MSVTTMSTPMRNVFKKVPVDPSCIKFLNWCKSYNISKFVAIIKRLRILCMFVLNFYMSKRYLGGCESVHKSY
jgi:hypothetical protein